MATSVVNIRRLEVEPTPFGPTPYDLTIVMGKRGTGKSTLIRDLAYRWYVAQNYEAERCAAQRCEAERCETQGCEAQSPSADQDSASAQESDDTTNQEQSASHKSKDKSKDKPNNKPKNRIGRVFAFDCMARIIPSMYDFVPPRCHIADNFVDELEKIVRDQEACMLEHGVDACPSTLIILEDGPYLTDMLRNTFVRRAFPHCRHLKLRFVISAQTMLSIPPDIRQNADACFCMDKCLGTEQRRRLWRSWFPHVDTFENFSVVLDALAGRNAPAYYCMVGLTREIETREIHDEHVVKVELMAANNDGINKDAGNKDAGNNPAENGTTFSHTDVALGPAPYYIPAPALAPALAPYYAPAPAPALVPASAPSRAHAWADTIRWYRADEGVRRIAFRLGDASEWNESSEPSD